MVFYRYRQNFIVETSDCLNANFVDTFRFFSKIMINELCSLYLCILVSGIFQIKILNIIWENVISLLLQVLQTVLHKILVA